MVDLILGFVALGAIAWLVVPFVRSLFKHNKEMKRLNVISDLIDEANALPDGPEKKEKLAEAMRLQGFDV